MKRIILIFLIIFHIPLIKTQSIREDKTALLSYLYSKTNLFVSSKSEARITLQRIINFALNNSNTSVLLNGDQLYMAFSDEDFGLRASVIQLKNGGWELIGKPGFTPGPAKSLHLTLKNGKPVLYFQEIYDCGFPEFLPLACMEFNGKKWKWVKVIADDYVRLQE